MTSKDLIEISNMLDEKITKKEEKKPAKGLAKWLTMFTILVCLGIGILGCFAFVNFNMANYVEFLPVFGILFVPLILSIGANSAVKKIQETRSQMKNDQANGGDLNAGH